MDDVIRLLPDSIANQIAAGEVVQRPASVVKELLENSIDAGATEITLHIAEAGKRLVHVIDNGKGMNVTDARMSFERHATSKIQQAEDLFRIKSMGFRGEALASIAAVAQVEMKSRTAADEVGTRIQMEATEVKTQEPVQSQAGTSISVRNLFFNIPARRNFLKSNPVEFRHINDEFQRVALSHADVKFSFYHNEQEVVVLEPGKLSRRIVQLFGKNYQQQLIPTHEETPEIGVTGYVGKPEFAKKTRGEQYFFVNNRFIKNPYLNHAVVQAYHGMLPDDFHPFYVLFITIDPSHVDINVHPTKTEVKFDDDRLLYGVISSAVRQSLASFNVSPSLDFNTDVNFEHFSSLPKSGGTSLSEKDYAQFRNVGDASSKNWEALYEVAKREEEQQLIKAQQEGLPEIVTFQSSAGAEKEIETEGSSTALRLHGQYLLKQVKSGVVIMDQCAAHQRILYEKYVRRFRSEKGVSQSVLFPTSIELNPSDLSLVMGIQSEIRQLGFDFEEFGQNCIIINGVPPEIIGNAERDVFEALIEQYKHNQAELNLEKSDNLARALAKRTCIRPGQNLTDEEINRLFDELFGCEQPNFTPDGQTTFVVLGLDKIVSLFNKD